MSTFTEKLRLQGVFRPQGGLQPGTPFGMPDLSQGRFNTAGLRDDILNENENERQHELELARMKMSPAHLPAIAQAAKEKPPMNVVFNPGITDFQRGTLAGRTADRASRERIAGGRLDLGREQIGSREDMLDTRGSQVMDQIGARADRTDSQIDRRGEIGSRQIGERAINTDEQIDRRGKITSQQIQDRGRIQEGIQNTRGTQGLDAIAARGRNAQQLQDTKDQTFTPGETKTAQDLAVRQLMSTNPELGSLITIGTGGKIDISPDATPEERAAITSKVFITRPTGDISLRPEKTPKYTNESTKKKKYKPSVIE